MKPILPVPQQEPKRIVYCEGEDENVLRAVQVVVDEGLAKPILVGRPTIIANQIERLGLRMVAGEDYEIVNIESDPRYKDYWQFYYEMNKRQWCDG
jgi:malate dehydrogenase (oxaloacetate-decarboxylating)(NADP+)